MKRDDLNQIARLVKQQRLRKEYTQQELSDIAGISLRSIQRIENAEVLPRAYTLKILSKHLEFSIKDDEPPTDGQKSRQVLNNLQKVILSLSVIIVLIFLSCAIVFQSPRFPENEFEASLFVAGIISIYTMILLLIWRGVRVNNK